MIDFIKKILLFILSPILNDSNTAISLTRISFIYVFLIACNTWSNVGLDSAGNPIDIPTYQVVTLYVLLTYMMFKERAADLISKFLDVLITARTGVVQSSNRDKKEESVSNTEN